MADRHEFHTLPPKPVRLAWCAWLEHHGIYPNDVPIWGWIERDEERRQVRYLSYVRDERGFIKANDDRTGALLEARVMQLEAAPSPWPDHTLKVGHG